MSSLPPRIRTIKLACFLLAAIFFSSAEQCHIPNIDRDNPGWDTSAPFKGDTDCLYGTEDCNPCVRNLLEQLRDLPANNQASTAYAFNEGILDIKMGLLKHPQGIARLAGVGNENWMLIPRHHFNDAGQAGIISIYFDGIESKGGPWSESDTDAPDGEMTHFFSTEDNKHPGGCQIIGQTLAVAHEAAIEGIPEPTWISFYDVSEPRDIKEINRFSFDGLDVLGTPYALTDKGQAICVGITRLTDGRYLMFALESRRRLPSDVGWFFVSEDTTLSAGGWTFLQFWHQDQLLPGKKAFRTYENINLVTDCTNGQIYMLGFFGKGRNNAIDVFEVSSDPDGIIALKKVYEKTVHTRRGGASFRAGGSMHLSPDHRIVIYAVEKSDKNSITIEEFSSEKISTQESVTDGIGHKIP